MRKMENKKKIPKIKGRVIDLLEPIVICRLLVDVKNTFDVIPIEQGCFWNLVMKHGDPRGRKIEYDKEKDLIFFRQKKKKGG